MAWDDGVAIKSCVKHHCTWTEGTCPACDRDRYRVALQAVKNAGGVHYACSADFDAVPCDCRWKAVNKAIDLALEGETDGP